MWCIPIILALHRKRKIVARSRLAKNCLTFETVSANTKMFLNQSTFRELHKHNLRFKDLNHDSQHNKSDSFQSLTKRK